MQTIFLLIAAFLIFFLGGYSFFKNWKNIVNIIFFLFTISIAGWILSILAILNISQALLLGELPFIFGSFIFTFLLLFCLSLEDFSVVRLKWKKIFLPILISLPSVILGFFALTGSIIDSVKVENGFIINTFGPLYYVFTAQVVSYAILVFVVLIYKYFKSFGIERTRIKYVFFGIILFIVPATMTNLILPTFFNIWSLNIIGPSFSLFMVFFMTYAIVRYHLMNIWIIIEKGAIFAILLSVVTFVYVFLGSFLGEYLEAPLNYLLPSVLITFGFIPLKNAVEIATDRIFFKKQYKLADIIAKIDDSLHSSIYSLTKSLDGMNDVIIESLRVKNAAIITLSKKNRIVSKQIIGHINNNYEFKYDNVIINYLNSHRDRIIDKYELLIGEGGLSGSSDLRNLLINALNETGFALAVPIIFKNELVGIYFIGEKLSKDSFTGDEINLLFHVARDMGSVINNTRLINELKSIDKAKSEFISVLSHQLRTPLTTARWNMELFLEKGLVEKTKLQQIQTAYQGVLFMSKQLDDLMTALEIEEKKVKLHKNKADINDILQNVLENSYFIANKNKTRSTFAKSLPRIEIDENRIRNVLDIILRNAYMYSQEDGLVLIESFGKTFGGKKFVVVKVSDKGMGIANKDKENIFSKFFRSHQARMISPNGLGLGLYIAKKTIEAHKGMIWFESNPENKGVSFYFAIPI